MFCVHQHKIRRKEVLWTRRAGCSRKRFCIVSVFQYSLLLYFVIPEVRQPSTRQHGISVEPSATCWWLPGLLSHALTFRFLQSFCFHTVSNMQIMLVITLMPFMGENRCIFRLFFQNWFELDLAVFAVLVTTMIELQIVLSVSVTLIRFQGHSDILKVKLWSCAFLTSSNLSKFKFSMMVKYMWTWLVKATADIGNMPQPQAMQQQSLKIVVEWLVCKIKVVPHSLA